MRKPTEDEDFFQDINLWLENLVEMNYVLYFITYLTNYLPNIARFLLYLHWINKRWPALLDLYREQFRTDRAIQYK
jgi:hypothetical protein